ncbi:MAG: class I SAM-dependent methyltransferase [Roseiflexaceae bacterium]
MSTSQTESTLRPTRGKGLLEPFLARQRARQANLLISPELRKGRILDIGCGSFPYFLSHTFFREKFAIERSIPGTPPSDIRWFAIDLNHAPQLPFEDGFFSVITLLAVVEHLDPTGLTSLFQEAHRVLRPGGRVIITTPAAWSDKLLHWMARVHLVSAEEIEEHAYAYTLPLLGWYFGRAGFAMDKVRFGYFEFRLNMWATAER